MHARLVVGISIALVMMAMEVLSLMTGVSTFHATLSLLCMAHLHHGPYIATHSAHTLAILAHAAATIALSFFVIDALPVASYWFIFGFCS